MALRDLKSFVAEAGFPAEFESLPVRQEASARRYFRLRFAKPPADLPPTVMLVSGLPTPYRDDDHFLKIAEFFREHKIPAPRVHSVDREQGRMLVSDVGEKDLCDALLRAERTGESDVKRRLMQHAIDHLLRIQELEPPAPVAAREFDEAKLFAEMEFLFQSLRETCTALELPNPQAFEFSMFLRELCSFLGRQTPKLFAHRDYHSRNIMVREERDEAGGKSRLAYAIIDFQDARLGLPWYDLASLLYDPYAPLNREERKQGLAYYQEKTGRKLNEAGGYYAVALQRLLKALGTYFHQVTEKRNFTYLLSIPAAIDRAEEVVQLGRFPDGVFLFLWELRQKVVPALETWVARRREESALA